MSIYLWILIWVLLIAFGFIGGYIWDKSYMNRKRKEQEVEKGPAIKETIPSSTIKSKYKKVSLTIYIKGAGITSTTTWGNVPVKLNVFRIKSLRRFYRWYYTKESKAFTIFADKKKVAIPRDSIMFFNIVEEI